MAIFRVLTTILPLYRLLYRLTVPVPLEAQAEQGTGSPGSFWIQQLGINTRYFCSEMRVFIRV